MVKKRDYQKKNQSLVAVVVIVVVIVSLPYLRSYFTEPSATVGNNAITLGDSEIKCVDGDTFWYGDTKIRLLAIDTPESTTTVEPYGKEASEYTCNLLSSATSIKLVADEGNEVDKYDRMLYWVFIDDVLLQESLVEEGLAEIKYVDNNTVNREYLLMAL